MGPTVEQINSFADDRLLAGCIYCGGRGDTREHAPSRVFLDAPYPENLPVVSACRSCNNGFSADEEYVACFIEVVVAGSTEPDLVRRPGIAKILQRAPALRRRIEASKTQDTEGIAFLPESDRVLRVLLKLALGHAAFELAQSCRAESAAIWCLPLHLLSPDQRNEFEAPVDVALFGEVGSRGMQRMLVTALQLVPISGGQGVELPLPLLSDWVDVQEGRYRYRASDHGDAVTVRMVIGEYLAAEVAWTLA